MKILWRVALIVVASVLLLLMGWAAARAATLIG
jgi:hypothetical protein